MIKQAQMRFTFKTEKSKGKYRSFYLDTHYIKFKKKVVGTISDRDWHISLMVKKEKSEEDPSPFRWITLKRKSNSLQEAKIWLNEAINLITEKYDLYELEH